MQELHQRIIRIGLDSIGRDHGFALAGGYAVQAHHIVQRPSQDVDLFTSWERRDEFADAVDQLQEALHADGLGAKVEQQFPAFARLNITDAATGATTTVDLAANIRLKPPVHLTVGPVLDRDDIAAGKTECLFTRAESRDFIDVHALVTDGYYTTEELLTLAATRDAGFDRSVFADMLGMLHRFDNDEFHRYGLTDNQVSDLHAFYDRWRADLTSSNQRTPTDRSARPKPSRSSYRKPLSPDNGPDL